MAEYASCSTIFMGAGEAMRPPRRMSVADAVEENLRIYLPGGSNQPWKKADAPYMVEPMNRIADRSIEGIIFVGPSRSGKTVALCDGFLVYAVLCDPGDMHIIHMTQHAAQRYSQTRIDRLNQFSPAMREKLSPYANDDNVLAKRYRNGMLFTIGWPTITQVSAFDIRYIALTDYDRFPDDIGHEGDVFTPARKRIQTFHSSGRIVCESSPGKVISDPKWTYTNPHEGPPCGGIFALYNQGDRRRWYWSCPNCREDFTAAPTREAFTLIKKRAHLICPHCGSAIYSDRKEGMNATGIWLCEGQRRDCKGDEPKTDLASYWLTGPAATYQSWDSLVSRYDHAHHVMERTGDEGPLQATVTTDFGTAYRPRHLAVVRSGQAIASRAEDIEKRVVPTGVLFLTAAVDVQKERFVVQVMGWGKGNERWLIDRYNLRWSKRLGGNGEPEPIDPARVLDDWMLLLDILAKPYPLSDDAQSGLLPIAIGVDSGGKAGVTERAYAFWKRALSVGMGAKVMLLKGSSSGPRVLRSFPDSSHRSDRTANAMGEIPVWILNTLVLKDSLASDLERTQPGAGFIHFPNWLGGWFYDELAAETRTPKRWENLSGARNEAFDLCVYNHAVALILGYEQIRWSHPPAWADPGRSRIRLDQPVPVRRVTPTKRISTPHVDRSWSL